MVLHVREGVKRFDTKLLKLIATGENEEALRILETIDPSKLLDSSGKSLLHWSTVELGNPVIIQYLIEKGCDIDAQDNDGNTPLWSAVDADQGYAMKALIEANANIHICNKKGESPVKFVLSEWILPGRGVVKLFLNKLRDECGSDKQLLANKLIEFKCPIYFAVLLRDAEITSMILDRGCCVGARCHGIHDTALHEAVAQSDLANVKLLVERGAKINALGDQDQTPLYRYNVWSKDTEEKLEVLKFLVGKGALLASKKCSTMPIERLMKNGQSDTVRTLIEIDGINWRARYISGDTALHFACGNGNPGVAEAIRLFRGKDFNINTINNYGMTALMTAVRRGFVETVECLLELGADVNVVNNKGSTALHNAYKDLSEFCMQPIENYQKIVDLLLLYGTNSQYFPTFLVKIHFKNGSSHKAKSVLARLAEIYVHDPTEVSNPIRRNIRSVEKHKEYFSLCKKELGEMKSTMVYGSITLLEFFNGIEDEKLAKYARNQEFIAPYDQIVIEKLDSIPHYYSNVIRRRVSAAVTAVKLGEQAASVICKIMGLNIGHIVTSEIVSYLEIHDIKNLCEVTANF